MPNQLERDDGFPEVFVDQTCPAPKFASVKAIANAQRAKLMLLAVEVGLPEHAPAAEIYHHRRTQVRRWAHHNTASAVGVHPGDFSASAMREVFRLYAKSLNLGLLFCEPEDQEVTE